MIGHPSKRCQGTILRKIGFPTRGGEWWGVMGCYGAQMFPQMRATAIFFEAYAERDYTVARSRSRNMSPNESVSRRICKTFSLREFTALYGARIFHVFRGSTIFPGLG